MRREKKERRNKREKERSGRRDRGKETWGKKEAAFMWDPCVPVVNESCPSPPSAPPLFLSEYLISRKISCFLTKQKEYSPGRRGI